MRRPTEAIDNNWLNFKDKSHLGTSATILVTSIKRALAKRDLGKAREKIQKVLELRKTLNDPLEQGEITVVCAMAHYEMYDRITVLDLLKEALHYYGRYQHHSTVVQWMLGACYVETTGNRDKGFQEWTRCIASFRELSRCSMIPENAQFYNRLVEMIERDLADLESEEDVQGVSSSAGGYPGGAGANKPGSNGTWQPQFPQEEVPGDPSFKPAAPPIIPAREGGQEEDWHRFARLNLFPVVEKIPAGGFGPAGHRPYVIGEAQVDTVEINGQHYRMIALRGLGKAFTLRSSGYLVVKISSDSMNKPESNLQECIDPGDYVLVHLQEEANDGDLVAAEIEGGDKTAILRRLRIYDNGNRYVLEPSSINKIHVPISFTRYQSGLRIHGVVVVIFKPV
jgi:hypothetical protein